MIQNKTLNFQCSSCGKMHEVKSWKGINVGDDPELKEKVRDGSLFVWECPSCGVDNLAVYDTLYHDPDEKLMIWLLPPGILQGENAEALENQLKAVSDSLQGYIMRRVDEIGHLIEKVNIFDAGLDDCVMELCKYVMEMELKNQDDPVDIPPGRLKFFGVDDSQGEIIFTYPENGKMMGLRTGFNVYEDCAGILHRNPSVNVTSGFARIDHAWVAGIFG